MKAKLFLLAASFLAASFSLTAQTVHETKPLYPISYSVGQFNHNVWDTKNKKKISSYTDYGTSIYGLGRLFPYSATSLSDTTVDSTALVSRSCFEFTWTQSVIPANASNIKVTVNYSTSGAGYTFKLTQISSVTTYDAQTLWNAAGNGNKTDGAISYGGPASFVSSAIANAIKNNLSTGKLDLGALSENESANNSNATVNVNLTVEYDRPAQTVTYWAQNDLDGGSGGQIGVGVNASPTSYASPKQFTAVEKSTVNLAAYDNQSVNGNTWCFNDNEAPANRSKWGLTVGGRYKGDVGAAQSYSFTPNIEDNNGAYTAYLHKFCVITRNDQTEFDGTQSAGTVASTVEGNSVSISAPSTKTIGGNNYVFAGWWDGVGANPRTITPAGSQTMTALYKVIHKSSDGSAFSSTAERKYVRTSDSWQHMVYSSMGHVWYETSTDNGTTWQLMNGGRPVDNGGGASPSIDLSPNQSAYPAVIIAFQEGSNIHVRVYFYDGHSYVNGPEEWIPSGESAGSSISPNIAWCRDWTFIVVWKKAAGIAYMLGIEAGLSCTGHAAASQGMIAGTNSYSSNPAISTDALDPTPYFDVAWEQLIPQQSGPPLISILTCTLIHSGGYNCSSGYWGTIDQYPQSSPRYLTVSSGSMKWNSHVSIITVPNDSWISWVADYTGTGSDPTQVKTVLRRPWTSQSFYTYGFCCRSASINKLDDNSAFYLGFSEVIPPPIVPSTVITDYAIGSRNLSYYGVLSSHAPDVQLCNGAGNGSVYATAFYTSSAPYYFQTTNSMAGAGLARTSPVSMNNMRGVAIENQGAGIFYSFGNLGVDGVPVSFAKLGEDSARSGCDSTGPNNRTDSSAGRNGITVDSVNKVLLSQPFIMKSESKILFSDYIAIGDSSAADRLLTGKDYVSFTISVVDAITGQSIGTIKQVNFDHRGLRSQKQLNYRLKPGEIKDRSARVKMVLETNIDKPQLSIVDDYSSAGDVGLGNPETQSISLQNVELITEYSLGQNYPNPFNPTTTISYTIPKDGMVTLKVFDVLGREVETLVNEEQKIGRYEVQFNGSRLASGVYFYQLKSGSYLSVKKMLMVK